MSNHVDLKRVQEMVSDLRDPRQAIYFADLLVSSALGWWAFIYSVQPGLLWSRLLAFVAAVLLLYRALGFIHELFHQQGMKVFRFVWHAVAGIPLLIPFLLYLPVHRGHHNSRTYGTSEDGEYEQFKGRCTQASSRLFGLNIALPLALWVRFALLTPLSLVFPAIREKVIPEFVHIALRMPYRAPATKESAPAVALLIEWWCSIWAWSLVTIGATRGWIWVGAWALLIIFIATLNTLRELGGTHLYVEMEEGRDARGQLMDSLNLDSTSAVTLLLCPVGLRFHALHHVAPYLPYHALARAHRRLMKELPAGSEYHQVTVASIWEGLGRLRAATR